MTTSGRTRRVRLVLQLVAALAVLGLLLTGASALARSAAESLLATNIQRANGLPNRPEVSFEGSLFLLQVLRGRYDEVDVTTTGLTSGPLRIERVQSRLVGVQVPFHDVLVRDIRRFGIERSDETATLTYADLNAYLNATGRQLSLAPAGGEEVSVTGSLNVFGQDVEVEGQVSLSVSDGSLRVVPREVDTGTASLNEATRLLLGQRLTVAVPMDALPFGHELTRAVATPEGVQLQAVGANIVVQP